MQDPVFIFSIAAVIIFIAFIADQFFKKSGIPAFIFLIFAGIILGPITNLISRDVMLPILGTIAELTLAMVLFYGGMGIKLHKLLANSGRVFIQVVLYVIPSTLLIATFANYVLGWGWPQALIFGSIVGGETTSAVMVPLSKGLKLKEATRVFLVLESAMNSVFSVILFLTFIGFYQTGTASPYAAIDNIVSNFSIGIVIGLTLSLVWIYVLDYVKQHKYTYVLTLGFLLATYVIADVFGGSALLAVLIFGVLLANHRFVEVFLRRKLHINLLQHKLSEFQEELSFLLEAFIFVFLGLIFSISLNNVFFGLLIGGMVTLILLIVRGLAVSTSTFRSAISKDKKTLMLLCAQGLTPATLSVLALGYGIPLANTFIGLVTYVIIFTNIVTAIGSYLAAKRLKSSTV